MLSSYERGRGKRMNLIICAVVRTNMWSSFHLCLQIFVVCSLLLSLLRWTKHFEAFSHINYAMHINYGVCRNRIAKWKRLIKKCAISEKWKSTNFALDLFLRLFHFYVCPSRCAHISPRHMFFFPQQRSNIAVTISNGRNTIAWAQKPSC